MLAQQGLRKIVCQINVENGSFCSNRDELGATRICEFNSLHSMLETVNVIKAQPDEKFQAKNEKYLKVLTKFIQTAAEKWIKTFVEGFNDENTCGLCINSVRAVTKCVEIQRQFDECDLEVNSYEDTIKRVSVILELLKALLKRVASCSTKDGPVDCSLAVKHVAFFLFTVAIQHRDTNPWTNPASCSVANDCISFIKCTLFFNSIEEFLLMELKQFTPVQESEFKALEKKCVIGKLLLLWKPYLSLSHWKKNPSIAYGFLCCLTQLRCIYPNIGPFIELFLPPSLLFVDDHMTHNKEMGVTCLIHILQNTGAEEIRWYGRAEVIYEALKLQLYCTEESLLRRTHEALLLILKVIVKDSHQLVVRTKYDEIFNLILQAAYQENKLVLRRVHTENLSEFIQRIGINVVKYMKELLDLFEEYLEVDDPPTEQARINVLSALKSLIHVAWPRIPAQSVRILKMLVKFVHQVTSKQPSLESSVEVELLDLAKECLVLLYGLDGSKMQECINILNCESLHLTAKCKQLLQQCQQ